MSLPQREHPEAAAELDSAVAWYEAREPGLGVSLIDSVATARQNIEAYLDAWPPFPGWDREPIVRSKRLDVFPYRVVYIVDADELVIVAYAHESRSPGYWVNRL